MAGGSAEGGVSAPIIVSALLGAEAFRLLDGLRQRHFPPERNHLPAHLTLFHHLPPSAKDDLLGRVRREIASPAPRATLEGLLDLGGGTAVRVRSTELVAIRSRLADAYADILVPQDRAGWRPHVTIQNKVPRVAAVALQQDLGSQFNDRPITIAGLAIWYYRGGPWEAIAHLPFRR